MFGCPDGLPTFYYPYATAVREGYLAIAARAPNRFVRIDANRAVEDVEKDILTTVEQRMKS